MSGRASQAGVVGSFEHADSLIEAIGAVRERGLEFEVFSPTPLHEIEHAIGKPKSPVRYLTFAGAVTGLVSAFLLTILSSWIWNLIVGGKPVVAIPAFMIPAFELTILFGGLATLLAILHFARVPSRRSPGYHERFSDDRFGLFVHLTEGDPGPIEQVLLSHHAERCWRVGGEREEVGS